MMFLATFVLKHQGIDLESLLGLHWIGSDVFRPYQFVSYMFMHANFTHILFNMFALWMFGYLLENAFGSKRFLIYYMVTGIGAAVFQMFIYHLRIRSIEAVLTPDQIQLVYSQGLGLLERNLNYSDSAMGALNGLINGNMIGASGAVFGILLAFGMLFPNNLIYVYFAIPVKAKWFVIIYGALELFLGFSNSSGDNVAHFAHLGGMIFGFMMLMYWKHRHKLKR
jgi:membrane associated rhomboid family serine protease